MSTLSHLITCNLTLAPQCESYVCTTTSVGYHCYLIDAYQVEGLPNNLLTSLSEGNAQLRLSSSESVRQPESRCRKRDLDTQISTPVLQPGQGTCHYCHSQMTKLATR